MEKNKITNINKKNRENIRILDIQEKERQRIARDLHDYSLQNLTHLIHKIELASMYIEKDTIQAKLELALVNNKLRDIIEEIRNIIFDLRPMSFDDLGFLEAIEKLQSSIKDISSMKVEFSIDLPVIKDSLLLITVFRIIQECSYNAIKHSEAHNLFVELKENHDILFILIKDNGKGFNVDLVSSIESHFGLSMVKERVLLLFGNLEIKSDSSGTEFRIEIPLNEERRFNNE